MRNVDLSVFDLSRAAGSRSSVSGSLDAGEHRVEFSGRGSAGRHLHGAV